MSGKRRRPLQKGWSATLLGIRLFLVRLKNGWHWFRKVLFGSKGNLCFPERSPILRQLLRGLRVNGSHPPPSQPCGDECIPVDCQWTVPFSGTCGHGSSKKTSLGPLEQPGTGLLLFPLPFASICLCSILPWFEAGNMCIFVGLKQLRKGYPQKHPHGLA